MTMRTLILCGALMGALATTGCGGDDDARRGDSHATASTSGSERHHDRDHHHGDGDADRDSDRDVDESHADRDRDAVTTAGVPETTAADQSEAHDDIAITQHIRRAVVSYDGLSMSARNVVIVTRSGVVTLRGTVAGPAERAIVAQLARDATGVVRVEDQLEIAN